MRTLLQALLAAAVLAAFGIWFLLRPAAPPEHRVFVNGRILSMDAGNRIFEALSVRGERIHRLGTRAEIESTITPETLVTDLHGKTLLPGFVDAHGHFPGSGLHALFADLNSPPIGGVRSIADIQERLRERLPGKSGDDWLAGWGYDDTLIAERRHPNRHDLDAVSAELPVYITHVSGHMGVGNTRALELLGLSADSPDPVGGAIAREPGSRVPAGLLEETAHIRAAGRFMDFGVIDGIGMALFASEEYVSQGVTTAQSGAVDSGLGPGLAALANYRLIKPRLVLFPLHDSLGRDILEGEFDPAGIASDSLIVGPVKIVADGSIQGYTGYLSEPYHVPFRGDAGYRGYPTMPREELVGIVGRFHAAGMQLAIHGNGDAAMDDILHAFELAQRENPRQDPRLIVIHAQMAREDQLRKMLELGATPSFFSAHTYYWGDRHRDIFMGPTRAARMSPTGSAESIGLRYSVHLDAPVVPMRPMQLLWSTVNRISRSGETIGPEQRVSPMSALRAMTADAAWQIFAENRFGSLEPGKLADIAILDGDPLTAPDARELEVVETIVGGVTVYRR